MATRSSPSARSCSSPRRRRATRSAPRSSRARRPSEVADAVKDDHAATFAEALDEYRATMDARARLRGRARPRHAAGRGPPQRHRDAVVHPASHPVRGLLRRRRSSTPTPVGTYIVTPPSSPEMMREHNRASIGNTSVHEAYPGPPPPAGGGDHEPEPRAPLLRRPRVRGGLGLLLRADDEGGRLRRHARRAGTSSTPMRSGARRGSSSTSSSIAGSSASTRRSTGSSPRPDSSVRRRWPRSSATPRRRPTSSSYLFGRHMIERLKADVERAARAPTSTCAASTTRCSTAARCRSATRAGCSRRTADEGASPRPHRPGRRR